MSIKWRTREELEHQVVTLNQDNLSRRAISRSLKISRNTVRSILGDHVKEREAGHSVLSSPQTRAPRASKLDQFKPRIPVLLARYPDITAQRVFEILHDEGFQGGPTAVKKYLRKVRPSPRPTPSLVTPVYGPGKMAECDWSTYRITYESGATQTVQMLSYVLIHSKRKYYDAYLDEDLFALMDGHKAAFTYFQGVPDTSKYDSQKPVVLRWEGQQPIYNPRFLAFAAHYEFKVTAVRGKPNAKPRVERSFWENELSFLKGRSFRDFADFRAQIRDWMIRIVDHRKREGSTALERFAEEQPHLLPLPRYPYDTAKVVYRVCSIDGFVDWYGNHYAVPYDHVTDILPIRITQRELFIYAADLRCLAHYELAPRGGHQRLDPYGFHPSPERRTALDLDQLRTAFDHMGSSSAAFFQSMSTQSPRVWTNQARRILALRERYDTQHVDSALAHALSFGILDANSVQRILAVRHPLRTLDEYVAEETARRVDEALGPQHTVSRDLAEYDPIPTPSGSRSHSVPSAEIQSCPVPMVTQDLEGEAQLLPVDSHPRIQSSSVSGNTSNSSA